ncbi:hypothetical protein DU52_18370, partial [Methanosarcina mazei]
ARVHFIPYLKEGVFVTLCAPVVIKKYKVEKEIKKYKVEKEIKKYKVEKEIKKTEQKKDRAEPFGSDLFLDLRN